MAARKHCLGVVAYFLDDVFEGLFFRAPSVFDCRADHTSGIRNEIRDDKYMTFVKLLFDFRSCRNVRSLED